MINERIKIMRGSLNLSQREMAKKLNISKSTYSRWETGETLIPLKHLKDLCNLTMISMDYALGLINEKKVLKEKIKIDKVVIGNNLRTLRKKKQLTQKELADMLNTTQSVISDYENGNTLIQTSFLHDTCNKWDISINLIIKNIDK